MFRVRGRMPNAEKIEKVTALKERIEGAQALLLAEYRGLSVHDATELRRSLSEQARFAIVKNTLFRRAAADAGLAELEQLLDGPTAVAFVDERRGRGREEGRRRGEEFPRWCSRAGTWTASSCRRPMRRRSRRWGRARSSSRGSRG